MSAEVQVEPHPFRPLRRWDAWRSRGRCRQCYHPRDNHPVRNWTESRWVGDQRGPKWPVFDDVLADERRKRGQ